MGIWDSIKNNHFAMMAVCCMLPVIVILGLQAAGITGWWLFPLALVVCVGSHAVMMALSAKKHGAKTQLPSASATDVSPRKLGEKEGSSCH